LVEACGAGQMTLEEFSRRTDVVVGAVSRADIVAVTSDIEPPLPASGSVKRRWFVPIGNRVRRGRYVLPEQTTAFVLFGEIHLDLRGATLIGSEPTIKLFVLAGNLRVLAPRGIRVEVDQSSLFGGRTIADHGTPAGPAAPTLRIRMLDVMGSVTVTDDPAGWSPGIGSPGGADASLASPG
jgi:hypothetical protein